MFDTAFATLFRAVDRIRMQLESADAGLRQYLAEELQELRQLGDHYMEHWLLLDEQIVELTETFDLALGDDAQTFELDDSGATPSFEAIPWLTLELQTGDAPESDLSGPNGPWHAPGPQGMPPQWKDFAFADLHSVSAAFRKGMGYFDLLLFRQAAESLAEVVRTAPNPVAQIYLAAAWTAQGRTDEARAQLDAVRATSTDTLFLCAANEVEAQLQVREGQIDAAIDCLRDSSRRMPEYQDVWYNLGVCYARKLDWQQAEMALTRALALDRDDRDAAILLGQCQFQRGDLDAAESTVLRAIEASPRHPQLLLLHSRLLHARGATARAVRLCRQLIDGWPDLSDAWHLLTWMLLCDGETRQAITVIKKRLSVSPNDSNALLQLGIACLLAEEFDQAEAALLQSLPKSADKSLVWIALGRISAARHDAAQAQKRFLRALRDRRKPVKRLALYYYGMALYESGRLQEAQKHLHAAHILGAPNPAIFIALGRVADRMGRPAEADRLFNRAEQSLPASHAHL